MNETISATKIGRNNPSWRNLCAGGRGGREVTNLRQRKRGAILKFRAIRRRKALINEAK